MSGFARWGFRHFAGPRARQRFEFDGFQEEFLREFWRRDRHGRRVYTTALWGLPKGSGKSPMTAVLGTHALVSETDAPEVYAVAGSRDQAGNVYDFANRNVQDGPLAAWVDPGATLRCEQHWGAFEVLSSDGDLAAGVSPSAAIVDEWWLFQHRKQREAYESLARAIPVKRAARGWLLAITTAGFSKETQLGETFDAAVKHPKLEVLDDGFKLRLRDEEAGFLMTWFGVPEGAEIDIEDPAVIRACNPAPWVEPADLIRELKRSDTNELAWRRLHLNQWTKTQDAWLPAGIWPRLRSEAQIPAGADIYVAVDAALHHDTTAVVWAARLEDGRIALRAKVFAAREAAPHHVYHPGGTIRNRLVMDWIHSELGGTYRIREIVSDPRFFEAFLEELGDLGYDVAEFPQQGDAMRDAWQHLYAAALAGEIAHDGDEVFARHVESVVAIPTERGWRITSLRSGVIDAATAAAMARERCMFHTLDESGGDGGFEWADEDELEELLA